MKNIVPQGTAPKYWTILATRLGQPKADSRSTSLISSTIILWSMIVAVERNYRRKIKESDFLFLFKTARLFFLRKYLECALELYRICIIRQLERAEIAVMHYIRPEPADARRNFLAGCRMIAEHARERKEFNRVLGGQF